MAFMWPSIFFPAKEITDFIHDEGFEAKYVMTDHRATEIYLLKRYKSEKVIDILLLLRNEDRFFWDVLSASLHSNSQSCKAGQRVSLITYCPCATGYHCPPARYSASVYRVLLIQRILLFLFFFFHLVLVLILLLFLFSSYSLFPSLPLLSSPFFYFRCACAMSWWQH